MLRLDVAAGRRRLPGIIIDSLPTLEAITGWTLQSRPVASAIFSIESAIVAMMAGLRGTVNALASDSGN